MLQAHCFGTIRNNTALKLKIGLQSDLECFGTIRNNTALKQWTLCDMDCNGFGTIRNNTALKRSWSSLWKVFS
ncbi:hypothetical protein ACYT69_11060, partial [Streptococcus pyogenes]